MLQLKGMIRMRMPQKQSESVNVLAARIGLRIFTRRVELSLRQDDVRKIVGLSKGGFSNIENGKMRVSAESLFRIACALEVPITYFFEM